MNTLDGKIVSLKTQGHLTQVTCQVKNHNVDVLVIDTPESNPMLKIDTKIKLLFKEGEVIVGSGLSNNIALSNRYNGKIQSIQSNSLLCRLVLITEIGSIKALITESSAKPMNFEVGDDVKVMIREKAIMLMK